MIDLHVHSTMSDGLKTPVEIFNEAQKLKLNMLSITDHNSVDAYKEIDFSKIYDGRVILGCELTCMLDKLCIELLAYGYDLKKLDSFIKKIYLPFPKMNVLETNLVIDKLSKTMLIIDKDSIEYDVENEYGNRGVHREIVRHKENKKFIDELAWNDPHEFSLRYLSEESSPFYVDYSPLIPSYLEVADAIKKSDGLIFIPHIYKYRNSLDLIENKILKKRLVDGIECYHSSFSADDIKNAMKIASSYNLFISGGTDTHGYEGDDEVKLGVGYGSMCIPDSIVEPWVQKLIRRK